MNQHDTEPLLAIPPEEEEDLPSQTTPIHHRTWPWIVLLILLGVAIGFFLRPKTSEAPAPVETPAITATLTVIAPPVEAQTGGGAWEPIAGAKVLEAGAHVRTGAGGSAEIVLEDYSVVRLNAETEIVLYALGSTAAPGGSIQLLGGELWNRLVNLKGETYEVDGGNALALVRGSAFSARKRGSRFAAFAVQHELTVKLPKLARTGLVPEGSQFDADPDDPALTNQPILPVTPQGSEFLESEWRKTNLERDIQYLLDLERRGINADLSEAARKHAECLLDATKCETKPTVSAIRTSVAEGVAVATLDLTAWDGRLLLVRWKKGDALLAEHDITTKAGDLLARDELPVKDLGDYAVEVVLDQVVVQSAAFSVTETPSSPPPSSSTPGQCAKYTSTATCGATQFLLDKDGDCVYDACQSCSRGETPKDTNNDGLKDACAYAPPPPTSTPPPASTLPPPSSSLPPPSSVQCQDPGACPYGYTYDQNYCRVCLAAPAPVCGNGKVERGETCDPPDNQTCDAKCQTIQLLTAPVCGDGTVEYPETCDPPNGKTCDVRCQVIQQLATPVCGNGRVESGEQCDPPDGKTCDTQCQTIIPLRTMNTIDPINTLEPIVPIEPSYPPIR